MPDPNGGDPQLRRSAASAIARAVAEAGQSVGEGIRMDDLVAPIALGQLMAALRQLLLQYDLKLAMQLLAGLSLLPVADTPLPDVQADLTSFLCGVVAPRHEHPDGCTETSALQVPRSRPHAVMQRPGQAREAKAEQRQASPVCGIASTSEERQTSHDSDSQAEAPAVAAEPSLVVAAEPSLSINPSQVAKPSLFQSRSFGAGSSFGGGSRTSAIRGLMGRLPVHEQSSIASQATDGGLRGLRRQGSVWGMDGWLPFPARRDNRVIVLNDEWWGIPPHRFMLHPHGNMRMAWDCVSLVLILVEAVLIPASLTFDIQTSANFAAGTVLFFALDIVLNFFTGFFRDGLLIMKQVPIMRAYASTWFTIDFLSTFPWDKVFEASGRATLLRFTKFGKLARILRLLRLCKLKRLVEKCEDIFCSFSVVIFVKMFKIVIFIALLCHWVACMWGWIGHPDRHYSDNPHLDQCEPGGPCQPGLWGSPWRLRYGLHTHSPETQYTYALRFATGVMTISDFGMQAGWWGEQIFVTSCMFFSFIVCSTTISKIFDMFMRFEQQASAQEELMLCFKEFMSQGKVPNTLQAKVKRYLEYQFNARKEFHVKRDEMMQVLSPWLRKELLVHLNRGVLIQHPFFSGMGEDILAHVCCVALAVQAAPSDIIMQRGQFTQAMLFVVRGKLTIEVEGEDGEREEDDPTLLTSAENASEPERAEARPSMAGRMASVIEHASKPVGTSPERLSQCSQRPVLASAADANMAKYIRVEGVVLVAPGYIGAMRVIRDGGISQYTVRSFGHSELLKLLRSDIVGLQKEFPALHVYCSTYRAQVFEDCSLELDDYESHRSDLGSATFT